MATFTHKAKTPVSSTMVIKETLDLLCETNGWPKPVYNVQQHGDGTATFSADTTVNGIVFYSRYCFHQKEEAENFVAAVALDKMTDYPGVEKLAKSHGGRTAICKNVFRQDSATMKKRTDISLRRRARALKVYSELGSNVSDIELTSNVSSTDSVKSLTRISKPSYWKKQIVSTETARMYLASLDLFRLALEAGCTPLSEMHKYLEGYVEAYKKNLNEDEVSELKELYEKAISESEEQ